MGMTRRDYEIVAGVLYRRYIVTPPNSVARDTVDKLAQEMARELKSNNRALDIDRFLGAVRTGATLPAYEKRGLPYEDSVIKVGDGGTYSVGSDRYPATVTKVILFKTGERKGQVYRVEVQTDWSTVISGDQMDGSAEYAIKRDEFGAKRTFRATADGRLGKPGYRFTPGTRSRYYNPSV